MLQVKLQEVLCWFNQELKIFKSGEPSLLELLDKCLRLRCMMYKWPRVAILGISLSYKSVTWHKGKYRHYQTKSKHGATKKSLNFNTLKLYFQLVDYEQ